MMKRIACRDGRPHARRRRSRARATGQQQTSPREMRSSRMSTEDVTAFTDARVAALKAGLKLTAEQEKNWPAVEAAIRDIAKQRADRRKERADRREARRNGRQRAAIAPRRDRPAPPERRRDDRARGKPQEARRRRRASLQEPRRWPEEAVRSAAPYGRPASRAATVTGSAAPIAAAEAADSAHGNRFRTGPRANPSDGGDRSPRRLPHARKPPGSSRRLSCATGATFAAGLLDSPASLC